MTEAHTRTTSSTVLPLVQPFVNTAIILPHWHYLLKLHLNPSKLIQVVRTSMPVFDTLRELRNSKKYGTAMNTSMS